MRTIRVTFRRVGALHEAEIGGYRIRIRNRLGPESAPISARELGHAIQVWSVHCKGERLLWEDWQLTIADAVRVGGDFVAERLRARHSTVSRAAAQGASA